MKKYTFLLLFLITKIGLSQVGIGTDTPTPGYSLDVDGSMLVQENFKVNAYANQSLTDNDNKLLVRIINSTPPGEVAYLDLSTLNIAPVNIADYVFTNLSKDNVNDVNLQFDATKYIVGLANFQHTGEYIPKSGSNQGHFVARTFISGGRWHLEIRNRTLDSPNNNAITYNVSLIVYDRKYFKTLTTISYNFGGNTTATIPAPVGLN